MPIVIRCTACGQVNKVPDLAAGKKAVCGRCKRELDLAHREPLTLSSGNFDSMLRADQPMLVDFWAAWCGPCRMIAPSIEALAEERRDILVGKLNVDENGDIAGRYRVSSIPTLVFFDRGTEKG